MDTTLTMSSFMSAPDAEDVYKSAHNQRVEVIIHGVRRRIWTLEQMRVIVAENFGLERTPAEMAVRIGSAVVGFTLDTNKS